MPSTVTPDLVTLTGGLSVSLSALRILWDLENRQFAIHVDGDALHIRPGSRLTVDDDRAIRAHREELVALVRYCTEVM